MNAVFRKLFIGELSWKRVRRSIVLIPISVYIGLFIIAWLFPNKVIFRPPFPTYADGSDVIKLRTADGETVAAKYYPNNSATFTILFSHGNAEDIGSIEPFIFRLRDAGFSVFTYDYRGYGRSEGSPSETNTYQDIYAAYQYLIEQHKVPAEKIILHGRSLGGGPSIELAAHERVGGLIIESSFASVSRVLSRVRIIPFDKFDNLSKIAAINCPLMIIHGRDDGTIPFHHGESLFAAAKEPKRFFRVEHAGHNDLFRRAGDQYLTSLIEFAESITADPRHDQISLDKR